MRSMKLRGVNVDVLRLDVFLSGKCFSPFQRYRAKIRGDFVYRKCRSLEN